ncbi:MAG: dipeptidase [Gemmatimonadota bacterium]|nr:dipeptidase [Gemmatimonadota bacterium]MDH5759065.1 dipeptidase [Gemmatimonadota bacterium]
MSEVLSFVDANLARFRAELYDFLRIPSISAKSEHDGDTRRAAEWLSDALARAGLTSEVIDTPGHPIVLGEWRGAGPDAPTVLIYGHYDVQPPEPLDEWESPPFEPTERDGRVYARGSADDKGQLYMHVKALEAHLQAAGSLPINVVVLAEGEEEVGSVNLVPFVEANAGRLACDSVIISDSNMYAEGMPSVLFSLRGLAYFEIHVKGARSDLHSGQFGGTVANPGNALATIIASLKDADGRITIDGFYDDVLEWDEETRNQIRSLPFDAEEYRKELKVPALSGEKGWTPLEQLWIRPTCDVNGILCGYTGEGAKTVLPNKAMAKVSFRLVPGQSPEKVKTLLEAHLEKVAPPGVTVELVELHGGRPWKAKVEGKLVEAASSALEAAFGTPAVLQGEGGSIPIVVDFEEKLKASALLVGFGLPGCNLHAPNEWFALDAYEKGIGALVRLYGGLG